MVYRYINMTLRLETSTVLQELFTQFCPMPWQSTACATLGLHSDFPTTKNRSKAIPSFTPASVSCRQSCFLDSQVPPTSATLSYTSEETLRTSRKSLHALYATGAMKQDIWAKLSSPWQSILNMKRAWARTKKWRWKCRELLNLNK